MLSVSNGVAGSVDPVQALRREEQPSGQAGAAEGADLTAQAPLALGGKAA
jgi:hypothetical protein